MLVGPITINEDTLRGPVATCNLLPRIDNPERTTVPVVVCTGAQNCITVTIGCNALPVRDILDLHNELTLERVVNVAVGERTGWYRCDNPCATARSGKVNPDEVLMGITAVVHLDRVTIA